jgi:hypothetical protein
MSAPLVSHVLEVVLVAVVVVEVAVVVVVEEIVAVVVVVEETVVVTVVVVVVTVVVVDVQTFSCFDNISSMASPTMIICCRISSSGSLFPPRVTAREGLQIGQIAHQRNSS